MLVLKKEDCTYTVTPGFGALGSGAGSVGNFGSRDLTFSGGSTIVTVSVTPNCAGGSGTAWEFTVACARP